MRLLPFLLAGAVALLGAAASAATVNYSFVATGVTGTIKLTYGSSADSKYPDARKLTGASGSFSYTLAGVDYDSTILGLVPVTHDIPEPENLLAPGEFSRFPVASGLEHGSLSFDNLIWPAGSPQTASDYPFHGGPVDIYGWMFDIGGGLVVNLWSDGVYPGAPGPTFGVAIASAEAPLLYQFDGASLAEVPLPAGGLMLVGGLGALAAVRRRKAAA